MISQRAKFRQLDTRVTTNQVHNTGTILRHMPVLRYHRTVSRTRRKTAGFVSIRTKCQMHKSSKIRQKLAHDLKCVAYTYLINIFHVILFILTALAFTFIFKDGNPRLQIKSFYIAGMRKSLAPGLRGD